LSTYSKTQSLRRSKVDEGFLPGYGTNEHGYPVFDKTISYVEIEIHMTFDESDSSKTY
jgi:hypothetical protein